VRHGLGGGKFSGASSPIVKEAGLNHVTTREIRDSRHVASVAANLEENLPGWKLSAQELGLESFVKWMMSDDLELRLAGVHDLEEGNSPWSLIRHTDSAFFAAPYEPTLVFGYRRIYLGRQSPCR